MRVILVDGVGNGVLWDEDSEFCRWIEAGGKGFCQSEGETHDGLPVFRQADVADAPRIRRVYARLADKPR